MKRSQLQELATLYFTTRQVIRAQLPHGKVDPNAWMRSETLRFIEQAKRPTMHEVAAYLHTTPPSVTSLVRYLERHGLARTVACKDDMRSKRLQLTKQGEAALRSYERRSNAILRDVFSCLSEAELREFLRLLKRVSDSHT